jgi:L-asparaginase II
MFNVEPLVAVTRGPLVESWHMGALAVVDVSGRVVFSLGDPGLVTFVRSSAKPLQAIALVESGAADHFGLTAAEIAVTTGSHNGEDFHTAAVSSILSKIGLGPAALACGVHAPLHRPTARRLLEAGEKPMALHNNCSGKHAGMLALAQHLGATPEGYYHPDHPVQQLIRQTMAEMTDLAPEAIALGVDGCGVPVFGLPLANFALAYARLADPRGLPAARQAACERIVRAMQAHPEMVGGTERLDTDLMRATRPRLIAKGGAEGYYATGLLPDAAAGRPIGYGLALKVADGDVDGRARPVIVIETLRQLGVLGDGELAALARYRHAEVRNHRGEVVGEVRPVFQLARRTL